MAQPALLRVIGLSLFWIVPMVVPAAFAIRQFFRSPSPERSPGIVCLALPSGLGHSRDPLADWELLEAKHMDTGPVICVQELAEFDPEPVRDSPINVELHGQAGQGDSVVYCFFDTETKRWFRLSPGGVDTARKLALKTTANNELHLVDLSDGTRYAFLPGRKRPVSLAGKNQVFKK